MSPAGVAASEMPTERREPRIMIRPHDRSPASLGTGPGVAPIIDCVATWPRPSRWDGVARPRPLAPGLGPEPAVVNRLGSPRGKPAQRSFIESPGKDVRLASGHPSRTPDINF